MLLLQALNIGRLRDSVVTQFRSVFNAGLVRLAIELVRLVVVVGKAVVDLRVRLIYLLLLLLLLLVMVVLLTLLMLLVVRLWVVLGG